MNDELHTVLAERCNDDGRLYLCFDDGLTEYGGREEGGERDEEVATGETGQVEQRVGYGGEQ